MNLEQHPEEMLDRALAGEHLGADQSALDEHLGSCRACAAHIALARARQEAGTASHWDDSLNQQAVEGALASFERGSWRTIFSFLTQRRWLLLTAGFLLALASASSAAWWYRQQHTYEMVPARHERPLPVALAPAPPPVAVPDPVPALPSAADDDEASLPQSSRVAPSAAVLFQQASALREQNRSDEAIGAFRRLQHLYPRARESRMSFAIVGRMLLDRGRPAQALAQFDQHLAQNGEATEEALAGRATALGQMGRLSSEGETWRRLLNVYPGSVYASQAKNRLSQLQDSSKAAAGSEHSR
jgi:tetratricopeptide (TPR) repeat protein